MISQSSILSSHLLPELLKRSPATMNKSHNAYQDAEPAATSEMENDDESTSSDSTTFAHSPATPNLFAPRPAQYSMERSDSVANRDWSIYRKLPISGTDANEGPLIRLLQIRPRDSDGHIHCNLIRRPLIDSLSYTALSYSWGSGPFSAKIFVHPSRGEQAHPILVSKHLCQALRRLQETKADRNVWIDAICIDQENMVERATQIHIMSQIFNQAAEVRIWLGEIDDCQDKPLEDWRTFWSLCQQQFPWWKRLWVVQECAYASQCPIVMLGALTMSLKNFVDQWHTIARSQRKPKRQSILLANLGYLRVPFDAWNEQQNVGRHRLPLLRRLRETAGRQCRDPHDKVYAILSLVNENEARKIRPDYRKPFPELLAEVEEVLRQHLCVDNRLDRDLFDLEVSLYGVDDNTGVPPRCKKLVQYLLDSESEQKRRNAAALTGASARGYEEIVQLLLTIGTDLNIGDVSYALQAASYNGHTSVVEMLLNAGMDVNVEGGPHGSALQAALSGNHMDIAKILLQSGADFNMNGGKNGSALQDASYNGRKDIVEMLLNAGADVNMQGWYQESVLHNASGKGPSEITSTLFNRGAEIDASCEDHVTALQAASWKGHKEIVSMLLDRGAQVNAPGGMYGNALQAASWKGYYEITSMLRIRIAEVNA